MAIKIACILKKLSLFIVFEKLNDSFGEEINEFNIPVSLIKKLLYINVVFVILPISNKEVGNALVLTKHKTIAHFSDTVKIHIINGLRYFISQLLATAIV